MDEQEQLGNEKGIGNQPQAIIRRGIGIVDTEGQGPGNIQRNRGRKQLDRLGRDL